MTAILLPSGRLRYHATIDGVYGPAVGYKLYTYEAGTTTPKATYADAAATTPLANPIVLDARGECAPYGTGSYKLKLTDPDGATVDGWPQDNVSLSNSFADEEWCGTATGTANALTLNPTVGISAYLAGQRFSFVAASANSGAVTVNVSSVGTVALTWNGNTALAADDLVMGRIYQMQYDGVRFQLSTPPAATAADDNSGRLATTEWVNNSLSAQVQARLSISGANLLLSQWNGSRVFVNGELLTLSSPGITLSSSGLANNTLYYIYAYSSSGTLTLESSATAYAIDPATGVLTKSGDVTRTLVGMARTNGSAAWTLVRSYYNDPGIVSSASLTAERSITVTTFTEVNSEIRAVFLSWSGETVRIHANGSIRVDSADKDHYAAISIDGTTQNAGIRNISYAANGVTPLAISFCSSALSEGYHYATLVGRGTALTYNLFFAGGSTDGERTTLQAVIGRRD